MNGTVLWAYLSIATSIQYISLCYFLVRKNTNPLVCIIEFGNLSVERNQTGGKLDLSAATKCSNWRHYVTYDHERKADNLLYYVTIEDVILSDQEKADNLQQCWNPISIDDTVTFNTRYVQKKLQTYCTNWLSTLYQIDLWSPKHKDYRS